jgi:hypothetical protein
MNESGLGSHFVTQMISNCGKASMDGRDGHKGVAPMILISGCPHPHCALWTPDRGLGLAMDWQVG